MKIAVLGAGAIGGLIAARLTAAGLPVPLVARRRTLDTLRRDGLTVEGPMGSPVTLRPPVTDDTLSLGRQDAVVLAVPAPALPELLDLLPPLLGPHTRLLPVVGGIPWWYPAGEEGSAGSLASVDPGGLLWNAIPAGRIVGIVPRIAVERPAPGYLRHLGGLRLALGPALGPVAAGGVVVDDLVTLFGAAGFNAVATSDIRAEVWGALPGPLIYGALGIATGMSAPDIARDPTLQPVVTAAAAELAGFAASLGHPPPADAAEGLDDCRILAQQPGRIRPDLTAPDRRAEIEAVLHAPLELATRAGATLPTIVTLRALVGVKTKRTHPS